MLLHGAIAYLFLLLSSNPLYGCTTICLPIHLLTELGVASSCWLLQVKLLRIFMSQSLQGHMISLYNPDTNLLSDLCFVNIFSQYGFFITMSEDQVFNFDEMQYVIIIISCFYSLCFFCALFKKSLSNPRLLLLLSFRSFIFLTHIWVYDAFQVNLLYTML